MKRKIFLAGLCTALLTPIPVSAQVLDYDGIVDKCKQENKALQRFLLDDGAGGTVTALADAEDLYITSKSAQIHSKPGETGDVLDTAVFGTELERVAVCDNGWSKVEYTSDTGEQISGFVSDIQLGQGTALEAVNDTVTVARDCDVLDFPGRKDGEVTGEVLEEDQITRTGIVDGIWSRIIFENEEGTSSTGYIPTNVLEGYEDESLTAKADTSTSNGDIQAGSIHKSAGEGVFAEAVDSVTSVNGSGVAADGVQVGTPISVSADASLKSLGTFRITHYCPCSICCGPWSNGITSTGVTAVTNRTIAVDPTQIPYGSKVVIDGQVYVAEDCGGAIKENCIDIYVGSHAEGESKGVYYTEVYLIQE